MGPKYLEDFQYGNTNLTKSSSNEFCQPAEVNNKRFFSNESLEEFVKQLKHPIETYKQANLLLNEKLFIANKAEIEVKRELAGFIEANKYLQEEVQKTQRELESIRKENQEICQENVQINDKFVELEIHYSNYFANFKKINEENEKKSKAQQAQHLALMEEFARYRQKCETSAEEQNNVTVELKQKANELNQEIANLCEEKKALMATAEQAKQDVKNAETRNEELKRQLEEKDKQIAEYWRERDEFEQNKNKEIAELTCKIRQIENVFDKPVNSVLPSSSVQPQGTNCQLAQNEDLQIIEIHETVNDNQYVQKIERVKRTPKETESHQAQVVVPPRQQTALKNAYNTRRPKFPVRYIPPISDFESDTDDNNYRPLAELTFNSRTSRQRIPVTEVDDESETSDLFDQVKRSKLS